MSVYAVEEGEIFCMIWISLFSFIMCAL